MDTSFSFELSEDAGPEELLVQAARIDAHVEKLMSSVRYWIRLSHDLRNAAKRMKGS